VAGLAVGGVITGIDTVSRASAICVGIGNTAAADAWRDLVRIIGTTVGAIGSSVTVGVDRWRSSADAVEHHITHGAGVTVVAGLAVGGVITGIDRIADTVA